MTTGPDDPHVLLGAFVLGGLSDEDHRTFTEHLRTCRACQEDVGQVSGLPRLLDLAGPTGGAGPSEGTPEPTGPIGGGPGEAGVAALVSAVARRRRRTRAWLTAAAAAAAVMFFVAGVWLGPRLSDSPSPPTARYTATAAPGSSARVTVDLVTRGWGTQLDIACSEMPTDGELLLWVVDGDGTARSVASWLATPVGSATVTGATALRPREIIRVEVRTEGGKVLATART
jgi:hypothetical protein